MTALQQSIRHYRSIAKGKSEWGACARGALVILLKVRELRESPRAEMRDLWRDRKVPGRWSQHAMRTLLGELAVLLEVTTILVGGWAFVTIVSGAIIRRLRARRLRRFRRERERAERLRRCVRAVRNHPRPVGLVAPEWNQKQGRLFSTN